MGDDILFDRLHDLADQDAEADARGVIQDRLNQLGIDLPKDDSTGATDMAGDTKSVAEGFGTNYAEQLAQKIFDQMPELQNEDDILNAGYAIAKQELGTRADGVFRDRDFAGDLISSYNWVKEEDDYYGLPNRDGRNEGVEEDLDTDGVMMNKPSNMSSESRDFDLERLRRLALT